MMKNKAIEFVLFDLDDTLTEPSSIMMVDVLFECLVCMSHLRNFEDLRRTAEKMWLFNHSSAILSGLLNGIIDADDIEEFWVLVSLKYKAVVSEKTLFLREGAVELIKLLDLRKIHYGIISNTHAKIGQNTLSIIRNKYNIDLGKNSLFLDQGEFRKPNKEAYTLYCERVGIRTNPGNTVYVGNTVGDIQFALNSNLTPFFIEISDEQYLPLPAIQKDILRQAKWIKSLNEVSDHFY